MKRHDPHPSAIVTYLTDVGNLLFAKDMGIEQLRKTKRDSWYNNLSFEWLCCLPYHHRLTHRSSWFDHSPLFFNHSTFLDVSLSIVLYFTIDLFSPKFTASITCAHITYLTLAERKEYTASSS